MSTPPAIIEKPVLPLWQRMLFASVLPSLVFYAIVYWCATSLLPSGSARGPGAGPGIGYILISMYLRVAAQLVFALPITICVLRMAFRPWQRRSMAVAGGFAGILVGLLMGGIVLLILNLFS